MTRERPKAKKSHRKKYQIEMTSLSVFLWGFCLFFLLGWIFLLGILVGRGFLTATVPGISELKDQVNKLQEMITPNKNSGTKPNKKEDLEPKLAFYERLSNKKDTAKTGGAPERKGETFQKGTGGATSQAAQEGQPEGRAANSRIETPQKHGVQSLQGPPDSVSPRGGQFTVQLASLEEKSGAERMIRRLGEKGYDAYYYEAEVRGKTYYRIRCGRFTNREEAGAFARKLAKTAGMKGFVIGVD